MVQTPNNRAFVFGTKVRASSFNFSITTAAESVRIEFDTQTFIFFACYKSDGCSQSYLTTNFSTLAEGIGNLQAGEFKITPANAASYNAIYQ
ncbi:MAG: hypothetical protein ACKO34_00445 [Vampirovibrionales bacterium]